MTSNKLKDFCYKNIEVKMCKNGKKILRKVSIRKGKGYKSVSIYHKKQHGGTVRKNLKKSEIYMIKSRKFIHGLFKNCKTCSNKKKK